MTYGPFDLSNATAAELQFFYWTQLGAGDELFWGASKSSFLYWGDKEEGNSSGWRKVTVDLEVGQPGRCPTTLDLGQAEAGEADRPVTQEASLVGNVQGFLVVGK